MIKYEVVVDSNGSKFWYLNNKPHREDGPAKVFALDDVKLWYLNGEEMTESEHKRATSEKATCEGKEVEIDGVTYVLKVKGE